jgi:hypothetical protein
MPLIRVLVCITEVGKHVIPHALLSPPTNALATPFLNTGLSGWM